MGTRHGFIGHDVCGPDGSGCGGHVMTVMGIVNVTADSFSDGGRYLHPDAAIARGVELVADGAAIIDVGGESTRPGASRIPADVEAARVEPVIAGLAAEGIRVSVDTMRASVAERALAAGATIVNDVSGGRADPAMAKVVAVHNVPWILMHWRPLGSEFGHDVAAIGGYRDVVAEVSGELLTQVDAAVGAGVDPGALILDPGLGFAKAAEHNWALLHALPALVGLGFPVLIGASRKRFLGALLEVDGQLRPPAGREVATAALSALAAMHGAWGVRVHDVASTRDAIAVAEAWRVGGYGSGSADTAVARSDGINGSDGSNGTVRHNYSMNSGGSRSAGG